MILKVTGHQQAHHIALKILRRTQKRNESLKNAKRNNKHTSSKLDSWKKRFYSYMETQVEMKSISDLPNSRDSPEICRILSPVVGAGVSTMGRRRCRTPLRHLHRFSSATNILGSDLPKQSKTEEIQIER